MQVSVEKTSELSRKMTITIPEDVIQDKLNMRLKAVTKDVRIDGFRPGKVPRKVIQDRYGARAREEVMGDLIQTNYVSALQESDLRPVGMPQIEQVKSEAGFAFTAIFEVYPELFLDNVNNLSIKKPVTSIEANDVDTLIERLRDRQKIWRTTEQEAQEGDRVSIKLSGICEGEDITDGTIPDFKVDIGTQHMIPGFEDQLKGLTVGAAKKFEINFPEGYINKELSGKLGEYDIEVLKVQTPVLPEINAEFIKAYGVASGSPDEFRADIEKNMQRELARALKTKIKNTVMSALFENISVTLPAAMIKQEMESLQKAHYEKAKAQNEGLKESDLPKIDFEEQAKRRVALGLILGEVIQRNEFKVEADKVRAIIDDLALSYEDPEELVDWYYSDKKNLAEIEQTVLEDCAIDWVLSQGSVIEEVVSFSDIMDPPKQQ